jgi:hypothetical protein
MRMKPEPMTGSDNAPADRVRAHSNPSVREQIDVSTQQCLESYAGAEREELTRHIEALEREWDVERYLQLNAGLLTLTGVALGAVWNRRSLLLPATVFSFLIQHAVQGWCPPLPVFRAMRVRTRREINREKYGLKALRGDFAESDSPAHRTETAPSSEFAHS